MIHSHDEVVWLALSGWTRVVPLALVTAEPCIERWKIIAAVGTLCLGYFLLSAPGTNYGSHIASFIDFLAQVFRRIPMIGLSRVASWWWLLPPASSLTPASVVVVIGVLRLRVAACRSTMSLAAAFAHVFFSDGGRGVLLIELNPRPLRVEKCLTQVWIVTALEYSGYPGDVGHGSSEAPLADGGEFGV
jgi:hypothetical protein